MPDVLATIPIIFESREAKTDEDMKSHTRFVINRITGAINTDTNLSLYLYVKKNNSMNWELVNTYTISKDSDRFSQKIHPVVSCIDYYVRVSGSVTTTCEITSLRVWQKIIPLGKHV